MARSNCSECGGPLNKAIDSYCWYCRTAIPELKFRSEVRNRMSIKEEVDAMDLYCKSLLDVATRAYKSLGIL